MAKVALGIGGALAVGYILHKIIPKDLTNNKK